MRHFPDDPELLPRPARRDDLAEAIFAPLSEPVNGTVRIQPSERGPTCEAWCYGESGTVRLMYRFRDGIWQRRSGFGEPWARCGEPALTAEQLAELKR